MAFRVPDFSDRPLTQNPYVIAGAVAAVTAIVLQRAKLNTKDADVSAIAAPPKAGQVGLATVNFNTGQIAAFKAALPAMGQKYAEIFARVGVEQKVSPIILAALMEQETGYGKGCTMPECKGRINPTDFGLMQINKKAHPAFFKQVVNGAPAYQDPYSVVTYGAIVLKQAMSYLDNAAGKGVEIGPKYAVRFQTMPGTKPDPRPLAGDKLLVAGIASYNAGAGSVLAALASGRAADAATYDGKYAKSVIERASRILANTNSALG